MLLSVNQSDLIAQFQTMWDYASYWDIPNSQSPKDLGGNKWRLMDREGREIDISLTALPRDKIVMIVASPLRKMNIPLECWRPFRKGMDAVVKQKLAHCDLHLDQDLWATVYCAFVLDRTLLDGFQERICLLKDDVKQVELLVSSLRAQVIKLGFGRTLSGEALREKKAERYWGFLDKQANDRLVRSEYWAALRTPSVLRSAGMLGFIRILKDVAAEQDPRYFAFVRPALSFELTCVDAEDRVRFWYFDRTEVVVTRLAAPPETETVIVMAKACRGFFQGMLSNVAFALFEEGLIKRFGPCNVTYDGGNIVVQHIIPVRGLTGLRIADETRHFFECLQDTRAYCLSLEKTRANDPHPFRIVAETSRYVPQRSLEAAQALRHSKVIDFDEFKLASASRFPPYEAPEDAVDRALERGADAARTQLNDADAGGAPDDPLRLVQETRRALQRAFRLEQDARTLTASLASQGYDVDVGFTREHLHSSSGTGGVSANAYR